MALRFDATRVGPARERYMCMPPVIGVFLVADGILWMTNLVPPFATSIFALIAVVAGVAEFSLLLWMVIFGVNNERWHEQARLSGPLLT